MKLADLRRLSIRKQLKIRFQLSNGMECVITEHGLAQVPALRRVPDFNLEQELAGASSFTLEPVPLDAKSPRNMRTVSPDELSGMVTTAPSSTSEHEEE